MLPESLLETRDLLYLARADLDASERLLVGEPLIGIALFHCQQAVEKALKAYLSARQQPYPYSHDLTDLIARCRQQDPEFVTIESPAADLTRFAIAARYQRALSATPPEHVMPVFQEAKRLVRFVEERLPPEVTR